MCMRKARRERESRERVWSTKIKRCVPALFVPAEQFECSLIPAVSGQLLQPRKIDSLHAHCTAVSPFFKHTLNKLQGKAYTLIMTQCGLNQVVSYCPTLRFCNMQSVKCYCCLVLGFLHGVHLPVFLYLLPNYVCCACHNVTVLCQCANDRTQIPAAH